MKKASKVSKKEAVLSLSPEKLKFYTEHHELLRQLALGAIFEVFPKMRNENLNDTSDLIQLCLDKALIQMTKWDMDKAINSVTTHAKHSKITNEEHLANKRANPEEAILKNFRNWMYKAMINRMKHVLQANPSYKYGKKVKVNGKTKVEMIDIRAISFAKTADRYSNFMGSLDTESFLGVVEPDDELFGADLQQALVDFDELMCIAETLDHTAALAWMNSSELTEKRRENLKDFMAKNRLNAAPNFYEGGTIDTTIGAVITEGEESHAESDAAVGTTSERLITTKRKNKAS